MSLILNDLSPVSNSFPEDAPDAGQKDLNRLDRYLAIIENNKKSMQFIPNDALVALDMAGFAISRLKGKNKMAQVSAARLALALVQPNHCAPVQ